MSRERRERLEGLQREIVEARREASSDIAEKIEFKEALAAIENLRVEEASLAFERAQIDRQTNAILDKLPRRRRPDFDRWIRRDSSLSSALPLLTAFFVSAVMISYEPEPMWLLGPATVLAVWLFTRR